MPTEKTESDNNKEKTITDPVMDVHLETDGKESWIGVLLDWIKPRLAD